MQLLLFVIAFLTAPVFAETPTAARQDALRELLLEDCGSCHGMVLGISGSVEKRLFL